MTFGKPDDQPIDPYVSIDVDENHLDRSSTKPKTFDPVWNENFSHEVQNAVNLGLTVFHDAAIPPDDFVANCSIPFQELLQKDKDSLDFWVCKSYVYSLYDFFYNFFSFSEIVHLKPRPMPRLLFFNILPTYLYL